MAIKTAEIHDVKGRYAGYAKFDRDTGKFMGTAGGYGTKTNSKNGTKGRGNKDMGATPFNGGLQMQGGNRRNGEGVVRNTINTVGNRIKNRTPAILR